MSSFSRRWLLKFIDISYWLFSRGFLFRIGAQSGHDWARKLLVHVIDRAPMLHGIAEYLRRSMFEGDEYEVGGVRLRQRLILAAGLLKGTGFSDEETALQAVENNKSSIIAGWRIVPALVGPMEYGSFTRLPRERNNGTVLWRDEETRSTQNRMGLPNPGARAAARFLGERRARMPAKYGINIAVSPGIDDIAEQESHLRESVGFFLDAGLQPCWFTLNLSCPNTEDDPRGHQLEAEARQLCGAMLAEIQARAVEIPLWVKVGPGLAQAQYRRLMRVFSEVSVKAIIATNTLAMPSPADSSLDAGVGGGALLPSALDAVRQLLAEKNRMNYAIDVIACGGILDGASFAEYQRMGVKAGQYWSALVFRGPFAAAIIENELAQVEHGFEAFRRESLA